MLGIPPAVILTTAGAGMAAQAGLSWRAEPTAPPVQPASEQPESDWPDPPVALAELRLSYPVDEPVVTGRFGLRRHPTLPVSRMHTGMDFGAETGDPVLASADGRVVSAQYMGMLGNVVVIEHGQLEGAVITTWYTHNERLLVTVGQQVTRGEQIALAGSTGNSTGPHLHFEVRVDGESVDPQDWFDS